MSRFYRIVLTVLVLAGAMMQGQAEPYPSHPISVIVPFPAGGPSDTIARILAERMRLSLAQPLVVENVTGASGSIGTGRVAHAAPDGYTLVLGNWPTHVINGAVYALQYDILNDFEPVALLATIPQLIVARKTMPARDLTQFVAWLKANPATALQGTSGAGSASHLAGVLLQHETGTHFAFVPYRGATPAVRDLIAGQIDFMIDLASNSLPHVRAGSIRAYAVTDSDRLAVAPDIPTVDESGLPGFHVSTWHALFAPKGTPNAIILTLAAAVSDALNDPSTRSRLMDLGNQIPPRERQTPDALRAFQRTEIEKWWPIVKAANIKPQ